jgi:hypothetical protein
VSILQKSIRWVMVISGLLTSTALYELFAPESALRAALGTTAISPMELITVRHWGALVGLFGLMLIYGAFAEAARRTVLVAASAGKAVFIVLALLQGWAVLPQTHAGIVIDSVTVLLFTAYLASSRTLTTAGATQERAAGKQVA